MKCENPACDHALSEDQARRGIRFHSDQCRCIALAEKRRVHFPPPAEVEVSYRMKCYECGQWYDGRKGLLLGICSEACWNRWEPRRRLAQAAEAELWRNVGTRVLRLTKLA